LIKLVKFSMPDLMHGLIGDTYLANGALKPHLSVEDELICFRLLSGSNSSIYRFSFSEGGFLEKQAVTSTLIRSPGGARGNPRGPAEQSGGDSPYLITETFQGFRGEVLKIMVEEEQSETRQTANPLPDRLTTIPAIPEDRSVRSRRFDLQTMGGAGMGMMGQFEVVP